MTEYNNYKDCIEVLISTTTETLLCYYAGKEFISSYTKKFKEEGKDIFILPAKDVVHNYSSIVIICDNTAVYELNINNLMKLDQMIVHDKITRYYMNAVSLLYTHKSYPNLKHHIIELYQELYNINFHIDNSDIYFYEMNKDILKNRYTLDNNFDNLDVLIQIYSHIIS